MRGRPICPSRNAKIENSQPCFVDGVPIEAVVVRRVATLLNDRKHWTKGARARTARSVGVDPLSPKAVRWSLGGALEKEAYALIGNQATASLLVRRCEIDVDWFCPDYWNDRYTHAKVRAMLRAALENNEWLFGARAG
jgi:hypothetical protein